VDVIEELLAKQAITEVLYRYCRAIDRMDADLARSCWHADGTADYGDLYAGSGAGFVEWVWPVHRDGFVAHSHQMSNLLIEVRGERAASEGYVTVALRPRPGEGKAVDIVGRGRYLDRWSKREGVWAIDHRRHVVDVRSIAPAGAATELPANHGRRGLDDPSYEVLDGWS
jgi:hypothetical protein